MGGPLAALGDKLFWSTWRPVAGLIGVMAVLTNFKPAYFPPMQCRRQFCRTVQADLAWKFKTRIA